MNERRLKKRPLFKLNFISRISFKLILTIPLPHHTRHVTLTSQLSKLCYATPSQPTVRPPHHRPRIRILETHTPTDRYKILGFATIVLPAHVTAFNGRPSRPFILPSAVTGTRFSTVGECFGQQPHRRWLVQSSAISLNSSTTEKLIGFQARTEFREYVSSFLGC